MTAKRGAMSLPVLKQMARRTAISALDALASWSESHFSRRERRVAADPARWLAEEERVLAEALAAVILPSDGEAPGAREAAAARKIETSLAGSPALQAVYIRGLRALDRIARRRAGRPFVTLAEDARVALLRDLEKVSEARFRSGPARRLPSRLLLLYTLWRFPEVEFLKQFADDVFVAFYTSPVGWEWLEYDGPPMPLGYLDPLRRRA
ncbi:MAG: gluconate 2-dehydrogenase subunit 3 family protein [Acidobacteriota bacterium]